MSLQEVEHIPADEFEKWVRKNFRTLPDNERALLSKCADEVIDKKDISDHCFWNNLLDMVRYRRKNGD